MTYGYNAGGLRVWSQASGAIKTFYIFSGSTLVGEVQNGVPAVAYTWGASGLVSERLLSQNRSLWYAYGPQGETRQLTDSAGAVADTYLYSPYGTLLASTGTDTNPFRYGGQAGYYTDSSNPTGTILCGLRWYNPALGRWLSRDPIGYKGGVNLYEYCASNPVGHLDPFGMDGNGVQFLIGEAKGLWNFATGFTTPVILGRQFTGNKDFGKIQSINADQADGSWFGNLLGVVASFFSGGATSAPEALSASPVFLETNGNAFAQAVAKWLGRKGAEVVTDEGALTVLKDSGATDTIFDGQIGKLLYEV